MQQQRKNEVPLPDAAPGIIQVPGPRIVAQQIALMTGHRALILVGLLDGPKGLPLAVSGYDDKIEMRNMSAYTRHLSTGIYEIKDEDALCIVIDQLQEMGSYRATVINTDGSVDPAYTI